MKKIFTLFCISLCFSPMVYAKKPAKTLIGTVSSFQCGDNCYLTIVDKAGKEHEALCGDTKPCEKMMLGMDADLGGYKGKNVKVTVGEGKQYDGAGNIMGTMDEFKKIQVLK